MKLKPCPFCGGKAILIDNSYFSFGSYSKEFWAKCSKCFASIEEMKSKRGAINRWNRRMNGGVVGRTG